jgi:hypothetical protein
MSIERVYYCEGPHCGDVDTGGEPVHVRTARATLPETFIEAREQSDLLSAYHHFCSWKCVAEFAAAQPWPERIELQD